MIDISFYPNSLFVWSNPFWRILKKALFDSGVNVVKMPLSIISLIVSRKKIRLIHFHYAYPDISRTDYGYMPKIIWNKLYHVIYFCQNLSFGFKLRLAKKIGYKIIFTVHNLEPHDGNPKRQYKNISLLYHMADAITVMGNGCLNELGKRFPQKTIVLIPHFHYEKLHENSITKKEARKKLGIAGDSFIYLFFGGIRRYKGIDILIRIFENSNPKDLLLITGDFSLDPAYTKEIERLTAGIHNIKMLECQDTKDIQIFMNAADVAVFPFRQITNSGSLILAKSFYKPTICMEKGNITNYINSNTDIAVKDEAGLRDALIEAKKRHFPHEKNLYLQKIPSVRESALMYKNLYEKVVGTK